jgi:hypothetical protein
MLTYDIRIEYCFESSSEFVFIYFYLKELMIDVICHQLTMEFGSDRIYS